MKRILFLSLHTLDKIGGGERYSLDTIRSIGVCGDQCTAYAVAAPVPPRQSPIERLRTAFVPVPSAAGGDPLSLRELLSSASSYDAVVVHQFLSSDIVFDLVDCLASDQRLLLTNLGHEPIEPEFRTCFQPGPSCWFVEISAFSARRSSQYGKQSIGVSAGIWRAGIAGTRTENEKVLQNHFCAVGRVLPHKGFEVTIAGLPGDCQLTIVGPHHEDPRYVDWLRSLAPKGRVELTGGISEDRKLAILRQSALLIASSHHKLYSGHTIPQAELLGLVIFEALAQGTIPVTSSIPPFREVMENLGLAAFVYQEDDPASLRNVIELYRSTPAAEAEAKLAEARQRMQTLYLWDDLWTRIRRQIQW